MKMVICAVFDSKVGAYATPFFVRTKGEAIRSFEDACNDDKLPFKKHPADYRLWCIGEFDDGTGSVVPTEMIVLAGADEFARRVE